MSKQSNYVKADVLKNFENGKMPRVKIDWRGLLYINRAGKLIKVKCIYSGNSSAERRYCTHDCACFGDPITQYLPPDKIRIELSLCHKFIECGLYEFLDERLLSIGERRYMNECGDFCHLDTRDDV